MERLSASQLRDTLKTLLEISRCPVCLEALTPETTQCVNGHPLCVSCREQLPGAECPVCREVFSNVRPSGFIHQVMQALPHPCRNLVYQQPQGQSRSIYYSCQPNHNAYVHNRYQDCTYFVKTDDDHEKYCGCKPTKCMKCDWSGSGKLIWKHVFESHSSLKNKPSDHWEQPFDPRQESSCFHPIIVQDQFFWVELKNAPMEKTLTVIFHTIPNGKTNGVYYGQIQLKLLNKKHKGETVLNMDPDVDSSLENCITIPSSILPKYMANNNLQYTLTITKDKWASVQNEFKSNKFFKRINKKK